MTVVMWTVKTQMVTRYLSAALVKSLTKMTWITLASKMLAVVMRLMMLTVAARALLKIMMSMVMLCLVPDDGSHW